MLYLEDSSKFQKLLSSLLAAGNVKYVTLIKPGFSKLILCGLCDYLCGLCGFCIFL